MTDQEFDVYLEEIMDTPPPEDLSGDFTPWRGAMNRILWGTGLTTLTFNFWNLDVILPAIGWIMLLLGYRILRKENRWFRLGYGISWVRLLWWLVSFAIHATIFSGDSRVTAFLTIGNYAMIVPAFLILVSLRGGIRAVQKKAGLPPHGGNGMLVWFVIITVLAWINFSGITAWGLMIAYICILRNLFTLSKELDEAGYAVSPAPVMVSDSTLKRAYAGAMLLALIVGYGFLGKFPMDWQLVTTSENPDVPKVRQELLDLGFPTHILEDPTEADLLSCKGALRVVVDVHDYPVNNGREAREQEGDDVYITTVYDQKELRLTGIGVELPGEREQWKIIHHFQWVIDPGFHGTEVIQLWPAYRIDQAWASCSGFSGQVLYTDDGQSYSSPYHSLEQETYTRDTIFWGAQTSTDVFAEFSMPNSGENHRGYVSYTIAEVQDGWGVDAWINYTHQTTWLQYPTMTAKEKHQTEGVGDTITFKTVQDTLRFFPPEEDLLPLS